MVDIGEEFKSKVPKATIDGKVGRHLQEALSIAGNYSNYNKPSDKVVLELGTNGDFTEEELRGIASWLFASWRWRTVIKLMSHSSTMICLKQLP